MSYGASITDLYRLVGVYMQELTARECPGVVPLNCC